MISFAPPATGTYVVAVGSDIPHGTGTYTLEVARGGSLISNLPSTVSIIPTVNNISLGL